MKPSVDISGRLSLIMEFRRSLVETGDPLGLDEKHYRLAIEHVEGAEYTLYTGREFVISPVMGRVADYLLKSGRLVRVGVALRRLGIDPLTLVLRDKSFIDRFRKIPEMLAEILNSCGVRVGYIPEVDIYHGGFLWELGFEEEFREHARRVYGALSMRGVRKLITISPHSAEILREVYPRYISGFNIEVKHYLEVLRPGMVKGGSPQPSKVAYHDPCRLARGLGIYREPRELIRSLGGEPLDHRCSGPLTSCCGAPAEAILPRLAREIARHRLRELESLGADAVLTSCPFCLTSLTMASPEAEILDLVEWVWRCLYG
jgi:Fe-S oxidoreductase